MSRLLQLAMIVVLCMPVLLADAPRAEAQPSTTLDGTEIRAWAFRGPVSRRSLMRALAALDVGECGGGLAGPVRMVLHVGVDGRIVVDRVEAHEEVRGYAPCVRRALARVQLDRMSATTEARVSFLFPGLGGSTFGRDVLPGPPGLLPRATSQAFPTIVWP